MASLDGYLMNAGFKEVELTMKEEMLISRAAALFLPLHASSGGADGWVSLEVSPLLARDAQSTLAEAKRLHARVGMPNLFVKIPGTAESLPAIEEAIFAGIPVNVTLLFSVAHYPA